jgi:hypothetical protein
MQVKPPGQSALVAQTWRVPIAHAAMHWVTLVIPNPAGA